MPTHPDPLLSRLCQSLSLLPPWVFLVSGSREAGSSGLWCFHRRSHLLVHSGVVGSSAAVGASAIWHILLGQDVYIVREQSRLRYTPDITTFRPCITSLTESTGITQGACTIRSSPPLWCVRRMA